MKLSVAWKSVLLIFLVLVLDQMLKIWVKTNMTLGEEFPVLGDWFLIHFTENNGMAFGWEWGGRLGKLVLSLFRLGALVAIGYYIYWLIARKAPTGFVLSVSLIFAGAAGNILDSSFYGLIFSESTYYQVASMLPDSGGYASFLHGRVVDMFYFPLIQGVYPDWLPLLGGRDFVFFRPIFNLADASITTAVFIILLFQRQALNGLGNAH
jgi:signal peptidase II